MPGDVAEGGQGFLESRATPVAPGVGKGAGCWGVVGEHTDPHCAHAREEFMTDKETLGQASWALGWVGNTHSTLSEPCTVSFGNAALDG